MGADHEHDRNQHKRKHFDQRYVRFHIGNGDHDSAAESVHE
jgi:hypothetical protein